MSDKLYQLKGDLTMLIMQTRDERELEVVLDVLTEVQKARAQHPTPMRSPHEGWGVIGEEWEELKEAIHKNDLPGALKEAKQVAAMGIRFIFDLGYLTEKTMAETPAFDQGPNPARVPPAPKPEAPVSPQCGHDHLRANSKGIWECTACKDILPWLRSRCNGR